VGATAPASSSTTVARFGHVLVDEFQDTNTIQYNWMKALGRTSGIPSRGRRRRTVDLPGARARVENLQQFRRDSRACRSSSSSRTTARRATSSPRPRDHRATQTSASARSSWTEDGEGERIRVSRAYNERDEAEFVRRPHPRTWVARLSGNRAKNGDHLYRSNAAVAGVREYLLAARIPYQACTAACGSSSARRSKGRARLPRLNRQPRRRRRRSSAW